MSSLIEGEGDNVAVDLAMIKLENRIESGRGSSPTPTTCVTENDETLDEAGSPQTNIADQVDREDDDDMDDNDNKGGKNDSDEEEKKGTYGQDVRESIRGPINLQDLRISMPVRTDELQESIVFFEQLLKENYGEFRFRKAMQIIEDFPGDIYQAQNEKRLLTRLATKDLFGANESAQMFLHECSSYLLMRQGTQGFTGKPIGILSV